MPLESPTASTPPPQAGFPRPLLDTSQTAGHYELVRKIADGGMGEVYEARLAGVRGFEKTVAIKTILPELSSNAEFVRMFVGEARLVADLVHENIVQVYQLGQSGAMLYMAQEFVEGVNLEQLMLYHQRSRLPLPIELGAFIISRLCRALEYAHARCGADGLPLGIVHRDVSPKNVLLNFEGVVKLADFGIAKAHHLMEQDEGEVLMGKAEYMSPEQASFAATDRRSDVFALGTLMIELLTGHQLFKTDNLLDTIQAVVSRTLPPLASLRSDLPDELVRIATKALQRPLDARYQTAGEMGYDLEYFMYHDRFGPTNLMLGTYLRKHFGSAVQASTAS
jgi:eukaryotic-like serine/threonine-protein kinase